MCIYYTYRIRYTIVVIYSTYRSEECVFGLGQLIGTR